MDDRLGNHLAQPSLSPQCARCARSPRSAEDRLEWATIDEADVCPGCLTLADRKELRDDGR